MKKKARRNILKGLAISAPVVWSKPVIDSAILPAHAQSTGCCAEKGCKNLADNGGSIDWPGGCDAMVDVAVYGSGSAGCGGSRPRRIRVALARSEEEAAGLLECERGASPFPQSRGVPEGCLFYECVRRQRCLLYGSPVLMSDGSVKPIETLDVGQLVRAVEFKGINLSFGVITKLVKKHQREAYFLINNELRITNDHPVRVRRNEIEQWIRVEDLIIGDLVKSQNDYTHIRSSEKIFDRAMTVYMETSNDHFVVQAETSSYVVRSKYVSERLSDLTEDSEKLALNY